MSGTGVVVGASSEIGTAIASSLASRYDRLLLWGRDRERLERCAEQCRARGSASAQPVLVDLRDRDRVGEAAHAALTAGPVRCVVWAAGAFQWGPFETADVSEMEGVLASSLTSAAVVARLLLPALIESAPSALIFIGSGAGRQAYPNNAAHVAAKHGLRGLAEALYLDVAERGVKVSTISAGHVNAGATRAAPVAASHARWLLTPDDIARAVEFVVDFPENGCPTEIVLRPRVTSA